LVLALLDCIGLVVPTRPLVNALADVLRRLPGQRTEQPAWNRRTIVDIARLIVAVGYVVVAQAILRHPVVAVFGESTGPFIVEVAFAIVAVLVLFALLVWTFRAARPLVEGVAREALDASLATSGSEEAYETAASLAAATRRPRTTVDAGATVRATGDVDATVRRVDGAPPEQQQTRPDATEVRR
jgi:hypothetical protein